MHTYIHTLTTYIQQLQTLQNIALHYIALHCITLHCIALHYITLHYIHTYIHAYIHTCIHTYNNYIHYITSHYITLHCIALHCITLHYIHTYIPVQYDLHTLWTWTWWQCELIDHAPVANTVHLSKNSTRTNRKENWELAGVHLV